MKPQIGDIVVSKSLQHLFKITEVRPDGFITGFNILNNSKISIIHHKNTQIVDKESPLIKQLCQSYDTRLEVANLFNDSIKETAQYLNKSSRSIFRKLNTQTK